MVGKYDQNSPENQFNSCSVNLESVFEMPLGIFFRGFCASPTVTPTSSLPMKANVAKD